MPSLMETVRPQPWEEFDARPPSQKTESPAHSIATEDNLLPLTARMVPFPKAASRSVVDGAVDIPPSDLKRGIVTDLSEPPATENFSSLAKVSRSDSGSTEALPSGWEQRHTPEGHPYYVDHNTRQTSWIDPEHISWVLIMRHWRMQQMEAFMARENCRRHLI